MYFDFSQGLPKDFVYAASVAVPYRADFTREAEGICNKLLDEGVEAGKYGKFQYISAVMPRKVKLPVTIDLDCSFDSYGAPLVVLAEELHEFNGNVEFGNHFEVVLYEGGINMWQLDYCGAGEQKITNLCRAKLPFPAGTWTKMRVEVCQTGIRATAGALEATCVCTLPENLWVGLTACEGINHFRGMNVRER